jgi:uncharacterized protein YqeY
MIHESIKAGIPEAMKARDEVRLRTLRSLATAMTNEVVAKKRKPDEFLTDDEAIVVLKRAANQRKDSISQYEAGGRPELAATEKEELMVIEALLPAQMGRAQVEEVVRRVIAENSPIDPAKSGMIVGKVMKEISGQADGALVKEVIDSLLAG